MLLGSQRPKSPMNIYMMKKPKRINSVTVTMAVGLLVIGYLLYWWIPILWPIFQMTGIMKSACNAAYKDFDDERVMAGLIKDARRTRLRISEDNFRFRRVRYALAEVQGMGIEDNSFFARRGKHCEIDFRYTDTYPIPFLGKSIELTFDRTVDQPLTTVKYKKYCTCVTVPGGSLMAPSEPAPSPAANGPRNSK